MGAKLLSDETQNINHNSNSKEPITYKYLSKQLIINAIINFWDSDINETEHDQMLERLLLENHMIFLFYRVDDIVSYNSIKLTAQKIKNYSKINKNISQKFLKI